MLAGMELLSPAGSLEKLYYAWAFGADAAYTGFGSFSLRAKADALTGEQSERLSALRARFPGRKLYAAVNMVMTDADLDQLEQHIGELAALAFDGVIVSDPGAASLIRSALPQLPLHLSTQANCSNARAVKQWQAQGFTRIVLARELSLKEIARIRRECPDVELEVFVHGAMCMAYSGRCMLSAWMADRSANRGECAHSCRWGYRVLEEKKRPGEYWPVDEGADYMAILSSRDLCMIDHLAELRDAGVDSLKIEGRMKSVYYTALVTRAYRKHLDALSGKTVENLSEYREDLFRISRRPYTRGFFFDRREAEPSSNEVYEDHHVFLGTVGPKSDSGWLLDVRNQIRNTDSIEYIGPDCLMVRDTSFRLLDAQGEDLEKTDHGKFCILAPGVPVEEGWLVRRYAT